MLYSLRWSAVWLLCVGGACKPAPEPVPQPPDEPSDTGSEVFEPCTPGESCEQGVCWVTLCGDSFEMGAPSMASPADERPRHLVRVPTFEIMKTEATVELHQRCEADGACRGLAPDAPRSCTQLGPSFPRGCLDWFQAGELCAWLGGRLPSEAEWEFAARSRGLERQYPWGEAAPDCELAVLGYTWSDNCGEGGPAEPCSRPAGQTEQGLCDMAGNLFEWVEDWFHDSYDGAPADGSAWTEQANPFRVLRGGGVNSDEPVSTWNRTFHDPEFLYSGMGVRCAR